MEYWASRIEVVLVFISTNKLVHFGCLVPDSSGDIWDMAVGGMPAEGCGVGIGDGAKGDGQAVQ
jgi:hypothetical protein